MAHLFLNLHHYTDITKMKAGFGNLREKTDIWSGRKSFFQNFSHNESNIGNLVEKRAAHRLMIGAEGERGLDD